MPSRRCTMLPLLRLTPSSGTLFSLVSFDLLFFRLIGEAVAFEITCTPSLARALTVQDRQASQDIDTADEKLGKQSSIHHDPYHRSRHDQLINFNDSKSPVLCASIFYTLSAYCGQP